MASISIRSLCLALALAACRTISPVAPSPVPKAPAVAFDETLGEIVWNEVAGEKQPTLYRTEGHVLDGVARMTVAEASPDALEKMLSVEVGGLPESQAPMGLGHAPRGLPAEFAFWMAVSDLYRQKRTRLHSSLELVESDDLSSTRSESRAVTGFSPAPGVQCSSSVKIEGDVTTQGESFGDQAEEALARSEGRKTSDELRVELGLVHESGWVNWSMAPESDGKYALKLHVSGDVASGVSSESSAWALVCTGPGPIFAAMSEKYEVGATEGKDGSWEVRVRRKPKPAPTPSPTPAPAKAAAGKVAPGAGR